MSDPVGRRELRTALLLCALGGLLALWGASEVWSSYHPSHPVLGETAERSTGRELYPALSALAWVGLAGALALVAARGRLRRGLGLVLGAAGAGIMAEGGRALHAMPLPLGATGRGGPSEVPAAAVHAGTGWVLLALAGGLLLLGAGALTAWRGGRWGGLGSSYEAPGAPPEPPVTDKAVWDALDRGDDPTA